VGAKDSINSKTLNRKDFNLRNAMYSVGIGYLPTARWHKDICPSLSKSLETNGNGYKSLQAQNDLSAATRVWAFVYHWCKKLLFHSVFKMGVSKIWLGSPYILQLLIIKFIGLLGCLSCVAAQSETSETVTSSICTINQTILWIIVAGIYFNQHVYFKDKFQS